MTFNKNLNAIDVSCLGELEQTRTHPRVFRKTKMGSAFQLHLGNCGLVYLLRVPLLIGFADAGIVRQETGNADAIVLLGGGLQTRAFEAARLYREGYGSQNPSFGSQTGSHRYFGSDRLAYRTHETSSLKNAVPPEAIDLIGNKVSSTYHVTYKEALALRRWGASKRRHKLIIPTELFHARRVSWLFEKLKGTGVEIIKFI